ncbi:MAG TPA: [protein-PII] uridylyltransferase, partial [Gammaproteobacteria bacterium]|nr:[protein-PII] uridylyltransferase [Gammaproteobacteria bacterium]
MDFADSALINIDELDSQLAASKTPVPLLRSVLKQTQTTLDKQFTAGIPVEQLVHARAQVVDVVLQRIWRSYFAEHADDMALIAVGGYGRGELHPCSDVDLLVLLKHRDISELKDEFEKFLAALWDIGLEIGHSTRSLDDCVSAAVEDITIATNLMESRLLAGSEQLLHTLLQRTGPEAIWPSRAFFAAKWEEQIQRHHKYHDTAYNLEPNIKSGPGGLRDIQMIGWITKRHFGPSTTLHDLVTHGFLSEQEYRALMEGQSFLWQLRFGLHSLTGRGEERLLFDHQRALATRLGYRDSEHELAVEQLMKRYYRTVMELSRLNEMLLQLFQENILHVDEPGEPIAINAHFQARKGFLEPIEPSLFARHPSALLELFLTMEQHPELNGVRAETIRLIRDHRNLIDDNFRANRQNRELFLAILRQPHGVTRELRRMNRYGILAAYLPEFAHIVGQMQHDLFHVYTVDEHTLVTLRNLRRFTVPQYAHEFPLCNRIISHLPHPEILYIAALFHDIGKGRGGNHSELGAIDAEKFCTAHALGPYNTALVTWLVRNHLVMSMTAQRKDISDPDVIHDFAVEVGDIDRLNHLYLLTVADIRATNANAWNSWKNALLVELYNGTKRILRRGITNRPLQQERIEIIKEQARQQLRQHTLPKADFETLWQSFDDDYFLRYSTDEIVWHTRAILGCNEAELPLVLMRQTTRRGGTGIFIYTRAEENVFAHTASLLEQNGLTIVDARIITSRNGYTLNTLTVLEQ